MSYEIVVYEADLGPETNVPVHKHSGPETWYLLAAEQCLELPDREIRPHAGETMFARPNSHEIEDGWSRQTGRIFIIVHDSSKPVTILLDWPPKAFVRNRKVRSRILVHAAYHASRTSDVSNASSKSALWELECLLAVAAEGIPVAVVRLFSRKKQVVILGNELECGDSCHSTIGPEKL